MYQRTQGMAPSMSRIGVHVADVLGTRGRECKRWVVSVLGDVDEIVVKLREHFVFLRELGVRMIPAYSPQARGRSERSFGTWQGRLPQELRLRGIGTVEAANAFLREHYIGEFNRRFRVASAQPGSAFMPCRRKDLQRIFSLQFERTVNRDNTVSFQNLTLQIEPVRWPETDWIAFDAFPNSFSIASMSANVRRTSSARAAFLWRKSGPSVRILSSNGLSTSRSRGSHWRVVRSTQTASS